MRHLFKDWDCSRSGMVWGLPEGADAFALEYLAGEHGGRAIFVGVDDGAMARMEASLALLGVEPRRICIFPAWDGLPYDRQSPNGLLMGQRLRTLAELCATPSEPRFILTTINAWLQYVPPRSYFEGASLHLRCGMRLSLGDFIGFASGHGYRRVETVRESGEYAVRGGIIDVFPPGHSDPIRVDFFDTEIEAMRFFDAETQRSGVVVESLSLHPVSEVVLNDAVIASFRGRYLEHFGGGAAQDSLYRSVSAGRPHGGMEHLLPLFHGGLSHLSDYAMGVPVMFGAESLTAAGLRFEQIGDFFTARLEAIEQSSEESIWRVLAPDQLYLDAADFAVQCESLLHFEVSRFERQDSASSHGVDIGGRIGPLYHASAKKSKTASSQVSPSQVAAEAIPALLDSGMVVLAASSAGVRHRMDERLVEHLSGQCFIEPLQSLKDVKDARRGGLFSVVWPIEDGFTLPGLAVITEKDIYGTRIARPQGRRRRGRGYGGENFLREVSSLASGDLVVHIDHGIGRYEGLEKITTGGVAHDCLLIIYAGGDKLFLPVENIDLLTRYGSDGGAAQLDRLGGASWQARKARTRGRIKDIAEALIKVAAARKTAKAEAIIPEPGVYAEFCQRFAYVETEDQLEAIDDVLSDLRSGQVMDRLICGDVGFGKTEVAMRAAFAVAMAGYQVAMVTPTTLLARQHGKSFSDRFKGFPIEIGVLSRMTTKAEASLLRKQAASGACQIIIGTHAVLSKAMAYSNLGLVIVDEEQRFGVSQKERLKSLRGDIHVLTLTATPIPRTLQMALSGVREMSLIATPPVDRLAVRTSVGAWDGVVLAEAIRRERFRGGQVFCVCPRINHLERVYERLLAIVPEAKIISVHGQMSSSELDISMTKFGDGAADILLATNIIESGIDIASANTMIIHRADMFGLAQLYQLRGRVGRSRQRAYAYLTVDSNRLLTPNAQRRLEVMQTLDSLGAGFSLASYDLDIRGAGNLLGDEQSGHVREVGVELYQDMLKEAVRAVRMGQASDMAGATEESSWSPVINMGTAVLIPDGYVADLTVRLSLYRRIAALESTEELDALMAELIDRFGAVPDEVRNLLDTISIKILCRTANVAKVDAGPKGLSLAFRNNHFSHPDRLIAHIASKNGAVILTHDHRLVMKQTLPLSGRAKAVKKALEELALLVA